MRFTSNAKLLKAYASFRAAWTWRLSVGNSAILFSQVHKAEY